MTKTITGLTTGAMFLLALTNSAIAETTAATPAASADTTGTTTATTVAAPQSTGSIIGILDVRPSWTNATGEFHMENGIEAGYKFNSSVKASAYFAFNNNLYDPSQAGQSLNAVPVESFVRASFSNIATLGSTGINLSYQPRAYIPVSPGDAASGHITSLRNYFTFSKKFSDTFSLSLSEIPILKFYQTAGVIGAKGATANPFFENRIYLQGDINITEKLSVSLPIMFHTTFHRNFQQGAAKNSATTYFMWINPEITYAATENLAVGLGYYSDNLIAPDLSAATIGAGLEAGVTQLFVTANL